MICKNNTKTTGVGNESIVLAIAKFIGNNSISAAIGFEGEAVDGEIKGQDEGVW